MTTNIQRALNLSPWFCMLWIAGCGSLSNNSTDLTVKESLSVVCSKSIEEQVSDIITPLYKKGLVGGTAVAVQYNNGPFHFYNFGYADKRKNKLINQHTLFAVGSITKGFTAEYISLLVHRDKLKWNTPFYLLSNDFKSVSHDAKTITIENLASHTSGFPRQINDLGMLSDLIQYSYTGRQFYRNLDGGFFVNWLENYTRKDRGSIIYSNLGYAVLDKAVHDYLHVSLSKEMKLSFINQMRLMETTFEPYAISPSNLKATGYSGDQPKFVGRGKSIPDWTFNGHMVTAAGLWSTSADLIKYASYHYNLDSIDRDIALALKDSLKVRRKPLLGDGVSVGWLIHDNPDGNMYYQSGFIAGFSSYIGIDPKNKTSIVVLQNQFNWTNNVGYKLLVRLADKDKYGCGMN